MSSDDSDPDVDGVVVLVVDVAVSRVFVVFVDGVVVLVVDVAVSRVFVVVFVVVVERLLVSNSWSFPLLKINWLGIFDNNFSILLKTLL